MNGEIADTRRPKTFLETSLPVRRYIPPRVARADLLVPGETQTLYPYRGVASFWPMQTKNGEKVELEVDG